MIAAAMAVSAMMVSGRMLAARTAAAGRVMLAVDRYAAYDPSLMLIDSTVSMSPSDLADLTTFLVGFSNVVRAEPASVDFVDSSVASHRNRILFLLKKENYLLTGLQRRCLFWPARSQAP